MQSKIVKTAVVFLLLLCTSLASAQDVSDEFIKTYHAYNSAYQQGDMKRAADLAQKTLELAVRDLGPDHEKIPVLLINLGHVNLLLGKYDDAEKYLTEAGKKIKPDQPDAATSLITIHEDMARIYAARKDLDKARQELEQAINLRSKKNGPDDPLIADLLSMQAQVDIAGRKYDSARRLINRGMQIVESRFGQDDNRVAQFQSMLGDLAVTRKDMKEAEDDYLRAMAILKKNLVADDPNILAMHRKLANLYIAMGSNKFASHADAYISGSEMREGAALPIFIIKPNPPSGGNFDSGWVLLDMTITEEGRVKDLKVVESNTPASIDRATLAAAAKWRFKPRIQDGKRLPQANTRARVVFNNGKVEVHLGEMRGTG